MTPLIPGFAGTALTSDERALFGELDPCGYILFARNVETPDQLLALTDDLRALSGRENLPILIDQEGGRIQRLRPPHWSEHPPAAAFGKAYRKAPMTALEAARLHGRAIADELRASGISVDCLPLLDVPVPDAHDIVGDRAFGGDPLMVASLGDALLRGLREGGVVGIVKHIPGHGRALADSHAELPVVAADRQALEADFLPFERLSAAPMAMTAHVRYDAVDADRCASVSAKVIGDVIRRTIGFGGFLMCDDIGMHALEGSLSDRMRAALGAGCDAVLHCSGELTEMQMLAEAVPAMSAEAETRLDAAMAWPAADPLPEADPAGRRTELLRRAAG